MIALIINLTLAFINVVLGTYIISTGNNIGFFNIGVAIYCVLMAIIVALNE